MSTFLPTFFFLRLTLALQLKGMHYTGQSVSFSEYRLTPTQWFAATLAYKNAERQSGGFDKPTKVVIDHEELHHHLSTSSILKASKFEEGWHIFAARAHDLCFFFSRTVTMMQDRVIPIFVFDLDFAVPMKTQPVSSS